MCCNWAHSYCKAWLDVITYQKLDGFKFGGEVGVGVFWHSVVWVISTQPLKHDVKFWPRVEKHIIVDIGAWYFPGKISILTSAKVVLGISKFERKFHAIYLCNMPMLRIILPMNLGASGRRFFVNQSATEIYTFYGQILLLYGITW